MSRVGIIAVVDRLPARRDIKKGRTKQQRKKERGRLSSLEESVDYSIYIYFTNASWKTTSRRDNCPESSDGTLIYFITFSYLSNGYQCF